MSKLFKLKEWLTIPGAARHLSGVFGEDVTEADVLRLGLDGHLTLSVDFVNGVSARLGRVVAQESAQAQIFAREITDPLMKEARNFRTTVGNVGTQQLPEPIQKALEVKTLFWVVTDLLLDDERYLHLEDEVSNIRGVWDLTLLGGDRLDIEHRFQQLTGGPEVEGMNLDGTIVSRSDGSYASIQDRFDSTEMHAMREGLQSVIDKGKEKPDLPHSEPKEPKPYRHPDYYFPTGGLPSDSVLVVRTSALTELQSQKAEGSSPIASIPKESPREKNNLLRIIGLMIEGKYKSDFKRSPHNLATTLSRQAETLGISLSDDTIAKQIRAAIDVLESSKHR